MARGRKRKISTKTLDEKIELQKNVLEKAKVKYEAEKESLAELIKLRNEMSVIRQIKNGLDSRFILGYLKDVFCRPVILFYGFSTDYSLTN